MHSQAMRSGRSEPGKPRWIAEGPRQSGSLFSPLHQEREVGCPVEHSDSRSAQANNGLSEVDFVQGKTEGLGT
jgi:hypothetical protein